MILPDYPIEREEQDQLKRFPLASKIATMISTFEGRESFVIGIEGKWGAGKTSFINLALGQLDKERVVHFTFNPWNFSDEASLLKDFFIKLSETVEDITGKKAAKRMREYAGKLSEMDLGISYKDVSVNPLGLLKFFSPDTSLEATRSQLDAALADIPKKIVVVIDDIDRLDKKETKLILKLVKLTADFPKTIFILAYDRARVEDRITEEENGLNGGEYLKKIIQVSFTLPVPDQQELWNLLFKDLDASIEAVYEKTEFSGKEETRWGELFRSGFNDLFSTIRDIKRYVSSLRLDWSIMGKSDVNKIDFLGIEAIRVFAPRFYDAMPVHKEIFVDTLKSITMYGRENEASAAKQRQYEGLLKSMIADEELRKKIDGICQELFPNLKAHSMDSPEEWERDLRICSSDRFDFYFQLGIPYGEISESQVDEVVASLVNRDTFKSLILQFKEEKRLRKLLGKILRRRDSLNEEQVKTILSVLWELEKQIDDGREAVFDLDDVETQVLRLAYHTLKQLDSDKRKPLLEDLIKKCPNLYYATHLIAALREDYTKNKQNPSAIILEDAELKELEQLLAGRIKDAAGNNTLKDEKGLVALLYRWKEWESPEAVSEYIKILIATREGLLTLLKGFVSKVLSSRGNYNNLNKESIANLYPIADIEKLVAAITDIELNQMSPQEKEAVELFRNPRRDW